MLRGVWLSGEELRVPEYFGRLGGGLRASPPENALPESYLAGPVQKDGDNDDGPEDHVLNGILEVELVHSAPHYPNDKGSNESTKDPATPSEEACASNYHSRDDFQFETGSHHGGSCIDPGGL